VTAGHIRSNVELKARDPEPARSLRRCRELGAIDAGTLHQRDTYFTVPHGRLKLREQEPGPSVLLQYVRADKAEARTSNYILVEIADSAGLTQALADSLGIACVVEKERRLFLWEETVRVHIDRVKGLGDFIEIEAVAPAGSSLEREREQVERLRLLLEIDRSRLVASSYADLLQ
jgi:adenylate cyclase class 2